MTKILLLAFTACAATALADSVTLNCDSFPTQFTNGTGSASLSCAGFTAPPGTASLDSVVLSFYTGYTFGGNSGTNDVRLTFGLTAPAGVTWSASTSAEDVTGGFSAAGWSRGVPFTESAVSGVSLANFANSFNLSVSSSVISGSVGTSSSGVQVTYNYTLTPTATPEPAAISLIGGGLVGLGFLSRRRKQ